MNKTLTQSKRYTHLQFGGLGDNLRSLLDPIMRRAYLKIQQRDLDVQMYTGGFNADKLIDLWGPCLNIHNLGFPIGPAEQYYKVFLEGRPFSEIQGEIPSTVDMKFSINEMTRYTPRPCILIQCMGGTWDGPTQTRKLWPVDRYVSLVKWLKDKYPFDICLFDDFNQYTSPLVAAGASHLDGTFRENLFFARNAQLIIGPDSVSKYLGPVYNTRNIVIWSQFHDHSPQEQMQIWYGDYFQRRASKITDVRRVSASETSLEDVQFLVENIMKEPIDINFRVLE